MQSNVVKTMILVCAFYVITWTPNNVYYLALNLSSSLTLLDTVHYLTVFVAFFYICANPFIYATKFDPVRRILVGLIHCKIQSQLAGESAEVTGSRRY